MKKEKDVVLVFSTDKFKKVMRAQFGKLAEIFIKNSKEWTEECEGLTPKEMEERYYVSSDVWLVKKIRG